MRGDDATIGYKWYKANSAEEKLAPELVKSDGRGAVCTAAENSTEEPWAASGTSGSDSGAMVVAVRLDDGTLFEKQLHWPLNGSAED